jgi:hypothetical protein
VTDAIMPSRRADLERIILAHHLGTAFLIASNAPDEKDDQLQWALDRFDHDRGRTMQDRESRAEATQRIESQLRLRKVGRRDRDTPSTYLGPSVI